MKSCAFFVVLFLSGLGLFVGGFVYDVMSGGLSVQDAPAHPDPQAQSHRNLARYLEVGGIAVVFGTVFAAAGWMFYTRERDEGASDGRAPGPPTRLSAAPDKDARERDREES